MFIIPLQLIPNRNLPADHDDIIDALVPVHQPLKLIYEFNKDLKLYYKNAELTETHELDSMINAKELLLMKHSPSLKPIIAKLKIFNRHVQNGISFLESLNNVKQHLSELINGLEFSDEIEDFVNIKEKCSPQLIC